MFGLGFVEILLVLTVALLIFGPKQLPEIAKSLGKTMGELRRTMEQVRLDINQPPEIKPKQTKQPAGADTDSPTADTEDKPGIGRTGETPGGE